MAEKISYSFSVFLNEKKRKYVKVHYNQMKKIFNKRTHSSENQWQKKPTQKSTQFVQSPETITASLKLK